MSTELTHIQKIEKSLANLDAKKSKIIFFVPDVKGVPAASIYELYFHADVLKKAGYSVVMMNETAKTEKPDFIESELLNIEHLSMESNTLTVGPEDVLVIPEIFTNVMESAKKLPCTKVVLFQSVDNATSALLPGYDWSAFGIKEVITTSNNLVTFVNEFFGKGKFNTHVYNVPVPDYFKDNQLKRLVISVLVRNERDLDKIVKLFYTRFPQYKWINFEPLVTNSKPAKHLRRKDFADRLGRNFAALWIDRIASHALFPLECMKVGTIPICYLPDITPEYLVAKDNGKQIENAGVWTDDFYHIVNMIAETLRRFLDDEFTDETYAGMKAIADQYSPAIATEQLIGIYGTILANKRDVIVKSIESLKAAEEAAAQVEPATEEPKTETIS